ncbi:hypothetical protein F3087_15840 [Nocardia colli]|uniref:Uncharacterized protein n=1 Tax=Nocardia colli TaxID=2545717 RepID=A0A5N0EI28_9NOCA|nr:hypothetical protein [Nocardia colli]KAA8888480.1 hypothetical protein F3087_15840 [Nocardia colli]
MSTDSLKLFRPTTVTLAAVAQFLVAGAFLSTPAIRARFGAESQAAAVADIERQGHDGQVLVDTGIRFDASGFESAIPGSVAAALAALAVLNLSGSRVGRIASLVFAPIVIAGNYAIMASNKGAAQAVAKVFEKTGKDSVRDIDIQSFLDAAESVYPSWLPSLAKGRSATITVGSALVVLLLSLGSARAYFRKAA